MPRLRDLNTFSIVESKFLILWLAQHPDKLV
jgi:hypothetical protein